jgi:hypothetical protein
MKKITVILAACAMFAFAACNKENEKGYTLNDDNTFNIVIGTASPEDADNGGKQALNGERMRILFTTEDQIMVNQNVFDINVRAANISGLPAGVSNRASVYGIPLAENYQFYFTAATYTVVEGAYKVNMLDRVNLLGNDISSAFDENNQAWPMYAEFSDPATIQENGLTLLNAVAVMSPAVVYGTEWADIAFASFYSEGHTFLPTDLPEVTVTNVVINSTNKMTGWSTLDNTDPTYPFIYMDETLANGERDHVICDIPEDNQITLEGTVGQRAVINVLGNLPVAPAPQRVTYQLNIYFKAVLNGTTWYYKFQTNDVRNDYPTLRNKRDWLQINFQLVNGNATRNDDGSIVFPNGTLSAPSATPYTVE